MITGFWLLAGGVIAIQAVLIALVPRRWVARTMLAWAAFPLLAFGAVVAWEGMTRPGTENALHNALLGLSLISAIFIIPWGLACAIGLAIGLGLRSATRRARPATALRQPDLVSPTHPAPEAPAQTSKAVFSTRATNGSSGSIADLPSGPHCSRVSPDGTIRIDFEAAEWGNSHWVQTPRVIDITSGRVILDLWNTDWDARISWTGGRRVSLDFQRYHFSGDLVIELDLAQDTYRITHEPGGGAELPSGPLEDAANAMEASGRRVAAFAAKRGESRPVRSTGGKPNPMIALALLVMAVVLIAVAILLSIGHGPQPAQTPASALTKSAAPARQEPRLTPG